MYQTGRVYWITGLQASGKTTIGTALYYALREVNENVLILDGDILKELSIMMKINDLRVGTAIQKLASY